MKKNLIWIVALSCSLFFGQSAFANELCGGYMKKMMERLKLDDAQKAKLKPVMEELKSTISSSESQLKELHTQISQQVQSDTMDQGSLDGLADKKSKLVGDIMKAKINAQHTLYSTLTAQQKTEYQHMMKQWEEKMAEKYKDCNKDE